MYSLFLQEKIKGIIINRTNVRVRLPPSLLPPSLPPFLTLSHLVSVSFNLVVNGDNIQHASEKKTKFVFLCGEKKERCRRW
jgi:hypothetical protein